MKTKMTMLGIVIAAFGCTVAMAAAPRDVGNEAIAPATEPAPKAAPAVSLETRVADALAKAVVAVSVLPVGG